MRTYCDRDVPKYSKRCPVCILCCSGQNIFLPRMRSVGFIPPSPASELQYEAISEDVMITRNDYRMQTLLRSSYG